MIRLEGGLIALKSFTELNEYLPFLGVIIYIKKGVEQSGPYSLGEVKEKLAEGELQPEDMACQEGNCLLYTSDAADE